MGVSEYQLTESLPKEFKGKLPSVEELEQELSEDEAWLKAQIEKGIQSIDPNDNE